MRLGFGPVFVYECITLARRWQLYATRVFFVGALLAALVTVWIGQLHARRLASIGRDAEAGEKFFYGVIGTELTLVLLLAPAATAGAICVDKTRGTLAHILITDLTDFEIVVGKLAARFVPVLALVAGTGPLLFLGVLLGGIDPEAVLGSLVVMLATAMLGSAIAMALSVWGRKTHEVLLGTFAILGLWLLAGQLWYQFLTIALGMSGRPQWIEDFNPFYLAFAAYRRPGATLWSEYRNYFAVCSGLSVLLAALATWRTRRVYVRQLGGPVRRVRRIRIGVIVPWIVARLWLDRLPRNMLNWTLPVLRLPGPSLDGNPVLWREWHRAVPSRFARITWAVYAVVATASTLVAIWYRCTTTGMNPAGVAAWVNGLQVSIGLLLLSVSAATSLAEERDRGTLDALLVTPLSTRSIVWGKWWGSFRRVPLLVILPTLLVAALSMTRRFVVSTATIAVLVLCYGAFLTSLGLALSTWVQRVGRAVAITVGIYVVLCVGSLFMILAVTNGRYFQRLATVSPFFGAGTVTFESSEQSPSVEDWGWSLGWGVAYAGGAVLLFLVTLVTFDRRLGRMPERHAFGWPESAPWSATIELSGGLSPASNEVVLLQPATLLPSVEGQSSRLTSATSPAAALPDGQRAD